MVSSDVQTVVDKVIRERLGPVRILSVSTEREEDFAGDEVLKVTVVVESASPGFDPKRLSSLVRHLRPKLAEHAERAFPLISFMTKADAKAFAL